MSTLERTTPTSQQAKPGLGAETVAEAFERTTRALPDQIALRTRGGEQEITWGELRERVDRFALGLRELELGRGEVIALLLANRPEFHIADAAALSIGAVSFSLYGTLTPDQIAHQLGDAGARIVVTEPDSLERVLEARKRATGVEHVVLVGDPEPNMVPFARLEASRGDAGAIERMRAAVEPQDLLTLIYTSGTTGPPKGVQLTHSNIVNTARSFDELIGLPDNPRGISYLPMAHIAERFAGHYSAMILGGTTTCCPNPRDVLGYLTEVRPTSFFGVPRVWEKLKAGVEAMIEYEQDPQRRRALEWAIRVGHRKVRLEQQRRRVPNELADDYAKAERQVLAGLREQLGFDCIELASTGAAPIPLAVLEFFHAIGVPLVEVWGLSESCGTGTANRPGEVKLGTVGRAAPKMELKLAEDGEVLLRGAMVMRGYRNLPDETAEAIDPDGWLHTGDVGELDEGYLRIIDRKKELIITAGGKNISPANLEAKLKAHPLIGAVCVIGDGRPFLSALIVLDPDVAPAWAQSRGVEESSLERLAVGDQMQAEIERALEAVNGEVSRVEQIKKFTVLGTDWLPGGDELTPTMKLKRKPIALKYAAEIEAMYAG